MKRLFSLPPDASKMLRLVVIFLLTLLPLAGQSFMTANAATEASSGFPSPLRSGDPQLILTKSIEGGATTANVGDVIRYRIRFECSSLTIACGAMEINDVLQAGLTYMPPPQSSVPAGFEINYNSGTRTVTITKTDNNLLDGTQYDAVIAVRVNNDLRPLPTTINNTLTGRIDPPGPLGWLSAIPAAAPPITVGGVSPSWNLSKVRVAPVIEPTPDTDVTYRLQLCPVPPPSGGIADLTDIVITDSLPVGAIFVSATNGGVYDSLTHTVTWPAVPGPLAPPDCLTRFITVNYPSPTFSIGDTLSNSANVSADYVDSGGNPCPDCFGDPVTENPDVFIPIQDVPTYAKGDAGDPVGITGTARFILELNTNLTNYPANDVTLIDNLPAQMQVTSVTSGGWSSAFDYVRAYVEYSTNGGVSWIAFPGQPVLYNTNATYDSGLPANITNVRWRFEYDTDQTLPFDPATTVPGLPYVWEFSPRPEIRTTPRAVATTDSLGNPLAAAVVGDTYDNCAYVTRTNSGGAVTDPCAIEQITVRGDFASLQVSKNETPGTPWDEWEDPLVSVFSPDATLLPGDTLRYVLTINLTERSSAPLVNPTILDTLPADLVFVRTGDIRLNGVLLSVAAPAATVGFTHSTPNGNPGADQTLLWEINNLTIPQLALGSQTLTVEFFARIPRGQLPGTRTNTMQVVTDSLDVICETGGQTPDGDDVDDDGNTAEATCQPNDSYVVERSAALRGEKWIRSVAAVNSEVVNKDTFLPDLSCPDGGNDAGVSGSPNSFTRFPCVAQAYPEGALAPGQHAPPAPDPVTSQLSYFEYQLRIFNDGNVPMLNYALYDILPYYGDKGSGGTLANSNRDSEFRPVLLGPVEFINGGGLSDADFTIQYSLSTNPCRPEVFNQPPSATVPAGCSNVWYSEAGVTDWSAVRAYRILLNTSSSIPPYVEGDPANIIRFGARMNILADAPAVGVFNNDDPQSKEIAWNSFSHVGSYETLLPSEPIRDLLASEPRKVGITIPERFSIGNRVWRDSDNSGTINAPDDTNPGIPDVLVHLYLASDTTTPIATTFTNSNGYYLFSNLPEGDYVVGIPASNFTAGQPLENLRSSTGTPANPLYTNPPESNSDSSDHGIDPLLVGDEVFSPVITLSPISEPINESDLPENTPANREEYGPQMRGLNGERDANSDLTVDFGFFGGSDVPFSIGNHLWLDNGAGGGTINNGIRDGAEPPVVGARVEIYRDGNLDGILAPDEMIRWDITDAGGFYLFDNLDPGTYYVLVPAVNFQDGGVLAGWYSSQSNFVDDVDLNDNGIDAAYPENTGIRSNPILLQRGLPTPTGETHLSGEPDPGAPANAGFNPTGWDGPDSRGRFGEPDENSNLTVDFGFIPPMSIGNRVWFDSGAGETVFRSQYNDGIQNGTEVGVANVRVELWLDNADGVFNSATDTLMYFTTTNAQGYYLFDRMQPGNYFVHIPASNFASGQPLFRYISSFDRTVPLDDATDMNDNGIDVATPATSGVTSPQINMAYTAEPVGETDLPAATPANIAAYGPEMRGRYGQLDENSNLTIDFGFVYPPRSIGNHLWYDEGAGGGTPNDRIRQTNELPVSGARVSLYRDDNNDGTPDGAAVAYDITDANGFYLFDNLPPGRYLVGVDNTNFQAGGPLEGYISSVGTTTNADQRDNGIDRIMPYDPVASPYGILSGNVDVRVTTNSPTGEVHVSGDNGTALGFNPTEDDGPLSRGRFGETDIASNLRIDFGFFRPMSLGNRVFYDNGAGTNLNNGLMDADEVGVAGVQVQLWRESNGTPGLQTAGATPDVRVTYDGTNFYADVTDANGYYLFDRLVPGNYYVYLPPANFTGTGVLRGWYNSDPTFDDDVDRNDNGINNAHPNINGISSAVIGLAWGTEPTAETELSGQTNPGAPANAAFSPTGWDGPNSRGRWGELDVNSNLTVDFGFIPPLSLGNRVWIDDGATVSGLDLTRFNDGLMNGTEAGRAGVILHLFYDADDDGAYTSIVDGVNESVPYRITTTDANGHYLFDGLPEGRFYVLVAPANFASGGALAGYRSSTGVFDDETGDLNDNGIDDSAYLTAGIRSRNFVLNYGGEPLLESDVSSDTTAYGPLGIGRFGEIDANSNLTLDFGFVTLRSLGNRVWLDDGTGSGIANNSIQDGSEVGIDGVTLSLYLDSDGNGIPDGPAIMTATTSDGGYYLFSNFPAGRYVVGIDASNFQPGGALETLVSSLDATTPVDATADRNDHGIDALDLPVNGLYSPSIDLRSPPGEPTGETDLSGRPQDGPDSRGTRGEADNESDLTVDFGFTYLYSLGNRVWYDTDNSGDINGAEVGVNGVTVQLYAADGSGNPIGASLATATTAGGGYYLFDNLYPGDYVVVIPASNFASGNPLEGYWSSGTTRNTDGSLSELAAPDPDSTPTDSDDNGFRQTGGALDGAVLSQAVTLGPTIASEPTGETDLNGGSQGDQPDGRANMTVDFGFYRVAVGNLVFNDLNKNGVFDAGDTVIVNAVVRLYAADGLTELAQTTTDGTGIYLFSGLPEGDYIISVEAPSNASSTVDNNPQNDNDNPNWNVDNNDNGVGTGEGEVFSAIVTLTPGGGTRPNTSPKPNVSIDNNTGTTTDTTLDFGFVTAYALGNRVWFDTDNSSTINGTEVGVDDVLVELYFADGSGNPGAPVMELDGVTPRTALTADGGYYLFDYLDAGNYVVVIPASNFASGGALEGYWSSATSRNNTGAMTETPAPDPDNDVDSDDNGTRVTSGAFAGAVVSLPVTLGGADPEPTGETDLQTGVGQGAQPDGRANLTVDFGFYKVALGSLVYRDENINGTYDSGTDTPLAGVTVELLSGDGSTVLATTTTDVNGEYRFDDLPEGDYIVRVTTPSGHVSTIDTDSPADSSDPNTNIDNNDNGLGVGPTTAVNVQSAVVALQAGNAGAQTNNSIDDGTGTTYDPTLDFGFVYAYSLGNRVWYDTNNNRQIDFASEVGIDGVTVQLYAADGSGNPTGPALATTITADGGYYLFDNLFPGDYVVVIPASNFASSGLLQGYWSSGTSRDTLGALTEIAAPSPDGDPTDSDDNGFLQVGGAFDGAVVSLPVTLGGEIFEPIDESDLHPVDGQGNQPDIRANMTVDFGFYTLSLGNLVWADADRNGAYDAGEPLYAGVTVNLYAEDGVTLLATTTTDVSGEYLFTGLPAGTYVVSVIAPDGTFSTIDSFNQPDSDDPNTNADNNDNGLGLLGGEIFANPVTLTPGDSQSNNIVDNTDGSTHNPTLDFGFAPVYSLGNRVWYDTNNNRAIDFGDEQGLDGVRVQLFDTLGNEILVGPDGILGTADDASGGMLTANGGYYLFNGLEAGDYVVVISASNFASGAVLEGYWSSGTSRGNDGALGEIAAPDPDNDADSDDNGMRQTSGAFSGAVVSLPVTLGPTFDEPLNESDRDATLPGNQQGQPDGQANLTLDFGFYTMRLGNQVWNDLDNNGLLDVGESGINGVVVQLWSADGLTLLATTTTAGDGEYVFEGLPAGNYILRLPEVNFILTGALRDYYSSTGSSGSYEPAPAPDADVTDSDDNGSEVGTLGFAGGYIQSAIFTLTPQAEQSFDHSQGLTTEFRIDFGVFNSPQVDLAITKDDGQDFYLPGGTLVYTIVVSNNGPADVTGATVSDDLPAQIESWTWVCAAQTGGASGCDGVTTSAANFSDTVDLPMGGSITYTVTANLYTDASGSLTNNVSVTPPLGHAETNDGNNDASDTDLPAMLTVTKTDDLSVVAPESPITYTIEVTNNGAVPLTAITVIDTLPDDDVVFQSATPAPTSAPDGSTPGGTVTWTGLNLAVGDSMTLTVTVRVIAEPGTLFTNRVVAEDKVTGQSGEAEDTDLVAVNTGKILFNTNEPTTVTPGVAIGEILTYQISIDVPGLGTMGNLKALDVLDSGLAFVRCVSIDAGSLQTTLPGGFADACNAPLNPTVSAEPVGSSSPVQQGRRILFDLGDVSNGDPLDARLVITYEVVVLNVTANRVGVGGLNNTVLWTWDGGSLQSSAPPLEIVEPDMEIVKNASPTVAPYGAVIEFTFDISHTTESTADAFDVIATDILPPGLAFIPGTVSVTGLAPTQILYDSSRTTLQFIWAHFPRNETASIKFQATFVGPVPVVNTVNLEWTSLPIDPGLDGDPVQQSDYNDFSTERWYDPADSSGLNTYGVASSVAISLPRVLPATGFAPGVVSALPPQPAEKAYGLMNGMWLEIPSIGVKLPILNVPISADGWDLTWLSNQAGYLSGTTLPGDIGTTGLTAHVTLADGTPGPFRNLKQLYWGNQVILYVGGYRYTYEVRENRTVLPRDLSVFRKDGYTWLTLLTCDGYVPWLDTYNYRVAVRAVLLSVEPDATPYPFGYLSAAPVQRGNDR